MPSKKKEEVQEEQEEEEFYLYRSCTLTVPGTSSILKGN